MKKFNIIVGIIAAGIFIDSNLVAQMCHDMSSGHQHEEKAEKKTTESKIETKESFYATIYTCPMHPEVQQDEPGNCPKCGMKLEKKQVFDVLCLS